MIAALVVPLALLDALHTYVGSSGIGQPVPWNYALLRILMFWLIYPPLIPPVLFLARRFRLDDATWPRNVLIHFVAALAFAYLHLLATGFVSSWSGLVYNITGTIAFVPSQHLAEFPPEFFRFMRVYFPLDFLAYWATVGVFYVVHYYLESRERELAASQLQASLTEARLQALRSQLNPHFLFNTLNTISVLALKQEHNSVVEVLDRLSNLLRLSLDDTRPQQISLASELQFVEGYLDIQRIRFADRLTVHRNISPRALRALVPSMILQPVVENAIKHGVSAQCGEGSITLEARCEEGMLHLQVGDSGPGFQAPGLLEPTKGIGLANTRERLWQLYGTNHRIECGQSLAGGASVTISIPFQESDYGVAEATKEDAKL